MKTNELRIGNHLIDPEGNIVKIKEIRKPENSNNLGVSYKSDAFNSWSDVGIMKPIPLTEERLTKLGFKMEPSYKGYSNDICQWEGKIDDGKQNVYFITWNKYVVSDDNRWGFWTADIPKQKKHHTCIASVYYVHQLQNLYFALTGKELEEVDE